MKSLQNKYNLIKEGKGNKELFLKEARTMFPNIVTGALTFDQAIHNLAERGIISENLMLGGIAQPTTPDWFKIFKENTESVKAELKETDKEVEEMETKGYDYKEKNNNNISTAEMLKGYYAEMKDPKNAEKTEDQIKAIVVKNLEKDPLHYVKDGEFGIKGLGYTDEHPGLGKTKEVTGKYKSSGMEPVKLNEVFYGSSDGDFDAQEEDKQMAYYNYDKGMEAYSEGDYLKADRYYTAALRYGSYVGFTEVDLPPYGAEMTEGRYDDLERMYNDPVLQSTRKGALPVINKTPALEKPKLSPAKAEKLAFLKAEREQLLRDMEQEAEPEGGPIADRYGRELMRIDKAIDRLKGLQEYDQNWDGSLDYLQDMDDQPVDAYDTKAMKMFGKPYDELDEYEKDRVQAELDHDSNPDYFQEDLQPIGTGEENKITLSEAKRKAVEKHLREIEKLGEIAAVAHKIEKINEKIEELSSKLSMTEGDDVKEMVDKKAVKELQKDIKLYEKKKAFYEKMYSKMSKKAGVNTMEEEAPIVEAEEEKPFTPPVDPDTQMAFTSMKRDVKGPKSWETMVKDLLKDKVPGTSK